MISDHSCFVVLGVGFLFGKIEGTVVSPLMWYLHQFLLPVVVYLLSQSYKRNIDFYQSVSTPSTMILLLLAEEPENFPVTVIHVPMAGKSPSYSSGNDHELS